MGEPQLVACPRCGTTNRVPAERLAAGRKPVCGRCGADLLGVAEPVAVTDASFASMVEGAPLPVLLDLWAPWCGPCRMVAPAVEQIARELAGRVLVAKMNVDENPATSERFQVRSIPMLLIFKGGRMVDQLIGAHPKSEILRRLKTAAGI